MRIKWLNFRTFLFLLLFSFLPISQAWALNLQVGSPVGGECVGELSACQSLFTQCWNDQAPGTTACGTGQSCTYNGSTFGSSWEYYQFNWETSCRASDSTGDSCTAWFQQQGDVCSTADKYNDRYSGGDLTMLRFGSCTCSTGNLYKTCCNGTTPINTYNYTATAGQGNPEFPDGACAYTTVRCGAGTSYTCGQNACDSLATPTPLPKYGCSGPGGSCQADSSGLYTTSDCDRKCITPCPSTGGWTGQSCSPGAAPLYQDTCGACDTCSVAACQQYAPNIYCYFNGGQCYNDPAACPNDCGTKCQPGDTQIVCNSSIKMCTL